MPKIFLASFLILIPVACFAVDNPLIDSEFKKINQAMEAEKKECHKFKNPMKGANCVKSIRTKYRRAGDIRGTKEYCEKHYSNKEFKELQSLLILYREQQKTARHADDAFYGQDRQLGEVTKEDLQTELLWIETRLARMQNAQTDEKEKGIKFMKKP